MRFAALAIFLVAAVSYGKAKTVEELIKMADDAGAPFTTVALEKMDNTDLWGAKRGRRSADIVIVNESGTSFQSVTPPCSPGSFLSPGLVPESYLDGHTSTVTGVQDSEDDEYAYVDCPLYYYGPKMSTFFFIQVKSENVRGDISVEMRSSEDIKVSILRQVENTQTMIMVKDSGNDSLDMLSLQAASRVIQQKLKGSRNMFVKASKRGTSVHTI